MRNEIKKPLIHMLNIIDWLLVPLTVMASAWLKMIRKVGVHRMKASKRVFDVMGVFPILDHYYEPLFNTSRLKRRLDSDRLLPGIDMNVEEQLSVLSQFHFNDELLKFPREQTSDLEYYYNNGPFMSGDAEYLYNMIRLYKPAKIVEIGCGNSTLMARNAIKQNTLDNPDYQCDHISIEPYQHPWLDRIGISVVRELIEDVDKSIFTSLGVNDILFIDSSHIIRPQGDVLVEYLEILPLLKSGVFVHVHDIFTPRDYLKEWVVERVKLWNEQYLLEAFLSLNEQFRVIGALNYLRHHHPEELMAKCPILAEQADSREPGSFWFVRS